MFIMLANFLLIQFYFSLYLHVLQVHVSYNVCTVILPSSFKTFFCVYRVFIFLGLFLGDLIFFHHIFCLSDYKLNPIFLYTSSIFFSAILFTIFAFFFRRLMISSSFIFAYLSCIGLRNVMIFSKRYSFASL